jgi:hypothetical protein
VRGLTAWQLYESILEVMGDGADPAAMAQREGFPTEFPRLERRTAVQTSVSELLWLMIGQFMDAATDPARNRALATVMAARGSPARGIDELYVGTLNRTSREAERDRPVKYVEQGGPPTTL